MKIRTAFLFDNFGPYHMARLKAAAVKFDLLAVEFGSLSSEYSWKKKPVEGFKKAVIHEAGTSQEVSISDFRKRMNRILSDFKPEVVFVPGWSSRGSLLALLWCLRSHIPVVMMSDSTLLDEKRIYIKEWMKRMILKACSSALVAGTPHSDYLVKLGFKENRINTGYDVVDNEYFERESTKVRNLSNDELRENSGIPRHFFLASSRFVKKKNLSVLLKGYAKYREINASRSPNTKSASWELVLLGDGPLRCELETLRSRLALEDFIHMPGFKQYEDLATYYGRAGVFIHASTTEQWGLVVNEAMASGLPVLVSNRCGCAPDLVQQGKNGWTFDPTDEELIASLLARVSLDTTDRNGMGRKSREIISKWSPARFAKSSSAAAQIALNSFRPQKLYFTRMLLEVLCRR